MISKAPKFLGLILLGAVTLTQLSCKNVVQNGDLQIVVIPHQTQAIPAPATTKACDGTTDISGAYVIYPTFQYTWNGDNDLQINFISIRFQSSYLSGEGTFSKIIAGDDLLAAFRGSTLNPVKGVENVAGCGIRVGGISFNTGVNFASVTGYLKILATEIKDDGSVQAVTSEIPISFEYEKF